ncbi:thymidylate synthase/dCMP hydroxymethylase domain-containing protein [Terfezia claveryi]|nr:thymidylate synthase/dCMP hydroxymethylase domain-containing protein [Terfezia claveryi]
MSTKDVTVLAHGHEPHPKPLDTIVPPLPTPNTPRNTEELQYLSLVREILDRGEHRPDRTGTGTYAVFAPPQLRFSLRDGTLPLLTTKRVFTKAILAELLWFISGSTSSTLLSSQGVKIWDGNGSRAFLDSVGLGHREEGDLGPVYGFQWRHFGAEYKDAKTDYTGQGVDQLAEVVNKLMKTPYDRRIILSAWNPKDLGKMALPPCHMFAQFYVRYPGARTWKEVEEETGSRETSTLTPQPPASPSLTPAPAGEKENEKLEGMDKPKPRGELHCCLYQRSCDMGLGVPFNIASYALLTHILAHVTGLEAGELIHCMGDTHVYVDHVDALKVQLGREPRAFPKVRILREDLKGKGVVDGFNLDDFEVVGYNPWPAVKMKMSV